MIFLFILWNNENQIDVSMTYLIEEQYNLTTTEGPFH